jgi:hypothetical protein
LRKRGFAPLFGAAGHISAACLSEKVASDFFSIDYIKMIDRKAKAPGLTRSGFLGAAAEAYSAWAITADSGSKRKMRQFSLGPE